MLHVVLHGRVTRDDLNGLFQDLYLADRAPSRSRTLVDLALVNHCDIGFREIHWLSVRSTEVVRRRKWTLNISMHAPSAVTFGLSRMYQQLFANEDRTTVAVSENRAEALQALGLDVWPVQPLERRTAS